MRKFKLLLLFNIALILVGTQCNAFTRIADLVFDEKPVEPDELNQVLEIIKKNKTKNILNKNPAKAKPDELTTIKAKQKDFENIQIEIDTSQVIVKSEDDIQNSISNQGFLNAVQDAIDIWNNSEISKAMFAPLKFASGQANPDDGRNIISFRAIETPEGIPDGVAAVSIITIAKTDTVKFMNQIIMVKPGTILDADIIYDPTNNPCLALETTTGTITDGGTNAAISEGGIDPTLAPEDLSNCSFIQGGDITDLAVRNLGTVLGLESSAIASSATANNAQIMTRYALTDDDKIGLANIYPNKENLTNHGIVSGKVILNKKPVSGAHVVLENLETGTPTASTIADINGKFIIKSIPANTYTIYAEPLDGPIRNNALPRNFFGFTAKNNFVTNVYPKQIKIDKNKNTRITIEVKELSASAFNINYFTAALTEEDVNKAGGGFILPIRIMPGETLTDVQFWGSNISPDFGLLTVSGTGITISNIREDKSISISTFSGDPPPDKLPGIVVDISCDINTTLGPRNIIYTGNQIDPTHPSFGLRDQISGGIFVVE